jgi:eukaryotic-like serine/threonine-protein kinase
MTLPPTDTSGPVRALEEVWAEVSPLLDEALALEPDARDAWLAELSVRAPDAASVVRTYLQDLARLRSERFLDGDATGAFPETTLAGKRIGAYTLERRLGYGGMGTVWLAQRSDGRFEGRAAVKLLNAALIGHPAEQRFVREGSVLARLQHPNIAHLIDAGVAMGQQPYLVLEYVEGERIDRYCENGHLSVEQRIRLFLDVLAAVAHAHRNLIVHRDIKPPNILVTTNGAVKLLDFGVAALLAPEDSAADLTGHAAPGLTPEYAAPEQLMGEPVTTATDVYALGLVLFVLLAGRTPLGAEGKTASEILRATLESDAPAPSRVAVDVRRGRLLRGDLDNIIAKALRRDPAERYATVESFAQDLRRYLSHEPVSARPTSFAYRAGKFMRRHRGGIVSAAAVALALVCAVIVTTTQMLEARRQRDQARYESRRAEATSDFMAVLLMSDGGPERRALTPHERLERGVELLDKQYGSDPRFLGRMLLQLANQFRGDTQTRRAAELYARAHEIGREQDDPELMIAAQCSQAYALALANLRAGVLERIEDANRLTPRLRSSEATPRATCLLARAQFEAHGENPAAAEPYLKEAIAALEAEGSTHRPIYVRALVDLGGVYLRTQRPAAALEMAERTGSVHEANGRGDTTARNVSRQNAAVSLGAMGEFRAALDQQRAALQRTQEIEGPSAAPPFYAINYAGLLLRLGDPNGARAALSQVIPVTRASGNVTWLLNALRVESEALLRLGRLADAARVADEGEKLARTAEPGMRAQMAMVQAELALARNDVSEAQRRSAYALELAGHKTPTPQRFLMRALLTAAATAMRAHAYAQAEAYARDALKLAETLARGAETSADVGESLLALARARMQQGAPSDARPMLERAVRCLENGLSESHSLTDEARSRLESLQSI